MDHPKRPPLLAALCILSFAGNGLAIVMYLTATIWNHQARQWISDWSSVYDISRFTSFYFLIFTLLYSLSFIGVFRMWQLKRTGFLFYIVSQAAILFLPSLWFGEPIFPSIAVIFTVLFAALYAGELPKIKHHSLDP